MGKYERRMKKVNKYNRNVVREECWNLDLGFVDYIVPRLEVFKEDASKIIEYDFSIVDKILEGFKLYQRKYDWDIDDYENNLKIVEKSMKLFAKHWMEFWW